MKETIAAIEAGDYAQAYDMLQQTSDAATVNGKATGAFLLALLERFDEAEQLARAVNLVGIHRIVRGELQRATRWRDPAANGGLVVATDTPAGELYAAMGAAFVHQDAELATRIKAEITKRARPMVHGGTSAHGRPDRDRFSASTMDARG